MGPEALSTRLSLTVPIQDGDIWSLQGVAGGSATHALLEDFTQIEVGQTGAVDVASGYADFLGTASSGIEL